MASVIQGGTIRLSVLYKDGTGTLVDPASPTLEIIDSTNTSVVAGIVPTHDSVGTYHYDYAVGANAPTGAWIGRFRGTIGGGPQVFDSPFEVSGSAWLITLDQLRAAEGIAPGDVDVTRDVRYALAIEQASAAIETMCDRNFGAPLIMETREWEYDGSGFAEIDDATAITGVTYSISGFDTVIQPIQWRAEPFAKQQGVYTYLAVPAWGPMFSPEMGFLQNIDVFAREGRFVSLGPTLKVTGTWGWPKVPPDVQRAVIYTAANFAERPDPYITESIAGYSHTSAIRGDFANIAIPESAKELLFPYIRILV